MTLILTSSFFHSYSRLKDHLPNPEETTVAFIPTAGNVYDDKWFVEGDKEILIKLGFKIKEIDIENSNYTQLKKELSNIDLIFVAGGNTFYLLDQVKKSGFDKILKEKIESGTIYIGSSAGSLLVCPTIEIAKNFDDANKAPDLTDYSGLNLVNFLILPHYGDEKYLDQMNKVLKQWQNKGFSVKTLRDDQVVIINK